MSISLFEDEICLSEVNEENDLATGNEAREQQAVNASHETSRYMQNRNDLSGYIIRSPDLHRNSALNHWIQSFFPCESWSSLSFAEITTHWTRPKTKSMQLANDAIGLINMGTSVRDKRLLLEGQRTHLLAVTCLRRTLSLPNASREGVLATALDLLLCELYRPVASQVDPDTWAKHLTGLSAIMTICCTRPDDTELSPFLQSQYCLLDLTYALVHRRCLLFSGYSFISSWGKKARSGVGSLLQLAVQLPSLLQKTDGLRSAGHKGLGEAESVRSCIADLEESLSVWMMAHHEHLARIDPDDTSSEASNGPLIFRSYLESHIASLYWILRLLICQCVLDLNANLVDRRDHLYREKADRYAALLRLNFFYLSGTSGGPICRGLAVRALLYFAGKWYETSSNQTWLAWCNMNEAQVRAEMEWIDWDALLLWSQLALLWLA